MKVTLWGTRGSIPTPSTADFVTSRYGGETTCVSIESGNHTIILDGGSGLRLLGVHMDAQKKPIHASFFFSHVHWDHIQGFPFFKPGFRRENSFNLYGPRLSPAKGFVGSILEKALRGQQEDLNFPVQLRDMPAEMNFRDLDDQETITISGGSTTLLVHSRALNHPGGCFGYRVEEHIEGKPVRSFAFCTDHEHTGECHPGVQFLAHEADLMLYDSQYTPQEYEGAGSDDSRVGWGHSTWEWALKEAQVAGVKQALLHHHDPLHDDEAVARIESAAREAAGSLSLEVQAATQNQVFEL
jgi:phosphoribosyl 1,2-cyclic phosphodiesterase